MSSTSRAPCQALDGSDRCAWNCSVMLDTLKELLAHQYEASLRRAEHLAIARCPERSGTSPSRSGNFARPRFMSSSSPTCIFSPATMSMRVKRQPFHIEHKDVFRDYEEMEDRPQVLLYEKPFVLSYLQNVRAKAQETIARRIG